MCLWLCSAAVLMGAAPGQWQAVQATTALGVLMASLAWLGGACVAQAAVSRLPEGLRRLVAKFLRALRASPPASLGVPFESE